MVARGADWGLPSGAQGSVGITRPIPILLPGRYLNGTTYRPRHIHVKVWVEGSERLTTQLYFEGDEYLECDAFASTSLVMPLTGSDEEGWIATRIDFVLA